MLLEEDVLLEDEVLLELEAELADSTRLFESPLHAARDITTTKINQHFTLRKSNPIILISPMLDICCVKKYVAVARHRCILIGFRCITHPPHILKLRKNINNKVPISSLCNGNKGPKTAQPRDTFQKITKCHISVPSILHSLHYWDVRAIRREKIKIRKPTYGSSL